MADLSPIRTALLPLVGQPVAPAIAGLPWTPQWGSTRLRGGSHGSNRTET
jgi:hypothetical protein